MWGIHHDPKEDPRTRTVSISDITWSYITKLHMQVGQTITYLFLKFGYPLHETLKLVGGIHNYPVFRITLTYLTNTTNVPEFNIEFPLIKRKGGVLKSWPLTQPTYMLNEHVLTFG